MMKYLCSTHIATVFSQSQVSGVGVGEQQSKLESKKKKQRRDKEGEVSGSESVVETSGSKVMRNAPLNIQYLCKRGT